MHAIFFRVYSISSFPIQFSCLLTSPALPHFLPLSLSPAPTQYGSGDCVVRLRGLPWAATSKDVLDLLKDCQVMNGEKGVHFTFAPDGRPSGEAFVELCAEEDVSNALNHNNEHMGRRYVEIFRASRGQMAWDCRMEEKGGGGSGGVVRLRGLPYRCSEDDVRKFFQGLASNGPYIELLQHILRSRVHTPH